MTKDGKVRFTLRIPESVYNQLACVAKEKGIATNSEISNILWQYVRELKAEKAR